MILRQGAEAEIHLDSWMDKQVVKKKRVVKDYRLEEIDRDLRRNRTKKEVLLMTDARRAGIAVPLIYDVDIIDSVITMEYLDAPRVKDIIDEVDEQQQKEMCQMIGKDIAKLHSSGLIHGDITTSNLVFLNHRIYFIDFGLGEKSEEDEIRGVDMHLLMEAFQAAHKNPNCFSWVLEEYKKHFVGGHRIEKKIEAISKRGRYMRRVE